MVTCNTSIITISKMNQKTSLPIFCFVLISFFGCVSAQKCSDTGFLRPNATYYTNRRLILSSLASNVTAQNGFYNASFGQDPDTAYAMGMCNPGTPPDVCSDCIELESIKLVHECSNQTDGFSWQSDDKIVCLVRYSNRPFSGSVGLDPSMEYISTGEINSNLTEFYRIWEALMTRVIDDAGKDDDAALSNHKYYAVDVAASADFLNIYVLMQCTPDISAVDCKECLQKCVGDYESCCRRNQGGAVVRPSCIFRWDLFAFGGAFGNITFPPQPSPTPSSGGQANETKKGAKRSTISKGTKAAIVVPIVAVVLVSLAVGFVFCCRRKSRQEVYLGPGDDTASTHSLQFEFKTIEAATDKFSESNSIGRGGFGEVYKGTLPNGTEIAVKRLAKTSGQGAREFKNEVVLVAKLQHRNLVRLLGFCLEGEEKILVYEFVPNKSLDYFLFDPSKQGELDWIRRYKIIGGIARGILYLHQDSRLTVIHRDLKASNILLDAEMNPKIADFGMAKILRVDQTRADTSRIVGTYGYMSPEYAMHGLFSMKSDVYSFGVLVLEIISGKMNSNFYETEDTPGNLVTHVWRLWRNGSPLELVDPGFGGFDQSEEVTRCIHIALLCVQKDPADRPTMSTIILMLTSNTITLPVPHQPGFFLQSRRDREAESAGRSVPGSVDEASITYLDPR